MNTVDDLAVIDTYMRQAAARAVADAIRSQHNQLALLGADEDASFSSFLALNAPVAAPAARQAVTVTPVPIARYEEDDGWWARNWLKATISGCFLAMLGLCAWAVTALVGAHNAAAVQAQSAAPATSGGLSTLGGLALVALIAVVWASCWGGGGKTFSGEFHGRMD